MNLLKTKNVVTPNASRFDVFISYSRDDDAFVRRLYDALNERERRAWVDWKGIPPTADWMAEVFAAVESADNFVFVLSEASLASEVCSRELEHAVKCRKRLVPFVWGEVDETQVPAELRRLNWIICRSDQDFPVSSASLLEALTLNLDWVREHTRLLVRSVDWRDGGSDASLLLRGSDLREAEQWLAKGVDEEPKPTELHRDYVLASRTQETRRGRRTLLVVVAGLVLAIGLAVVAWMQRQEAKRNEDTANKARIEADRQRIEAERQTVTALTNESNASLGLGRGLEALVASMKAGKKLQQEKTLREDPKAVYRTLVALRRALTNGRERNRIATEHFRGVTHLAFSPDDQNIYSVGGGGDIKLWSLDGKLLQTFDTELAANVDGCPWIQNFAVSPDGKLLAALGNWGLFALWDATGAKKGEFDSEVRPTEDGMCTGILNSKINFTSQTVTIRDAEQESVWTFAGGVTRTPIAVSSDGETPKNKVSNADGSLVASSDNDNTISIQQRVGNVILRLTQQRTPTFSHRSGQLATVSADVDERIIRIWDLTAPPIPATMKERAAAEPKKKLKLGDRNVNLDFREASDRLDGNRFEGVISPDGKLAAMTVSDLGQKVALWRISSGGSTLIAEFDAEQIASADFSEAVQSLAFSYDSQLLASGGTDGTVKLWDLNGKLVRTIVAHSLYTSVRFSPDGLLLLTWGDGRDGEVAVKLWTIEGELLDSLSTERVKEAWFSEDGKWIFATGETRSKKKAWSLDLDQLLHDGCNALRLYLANPATKEDAKICS